MNKPRFGKNMKNTLDFYMLYRGWHTFDANHRATFKAIMRLVELGLLQVNEYNQARLFLTSDKPLSGK